MDKWSSCKTLFFTFFKIGLFTFGGGYAMVPLIERETVENHHWITDQEMLNILAISESTPGPISINSATFIGYRVAGVWGSAAATLGTVLPSFIVISILSLFIMQYKRIQWLNWMFEGIRACVFVLIANAVLKFGKKCPRNNFNAIVILVAFLGTSFFGMSAILTLILAACAGIIRQLVIARREGTKGGVETQ